MADGKKARELGVLVAAFFAVLGLAGFLFKYHEIRRAAELDAQLAQDAARLGREIELRYKNYRAMVDNVTRLKTSGGAPRASATAEAAGAKTPSVAEYVNSLVVLPSQKDELQKCEQQPSLGEAQLCVAEQMRRLNDATGVEMVACAATSSTPSLSA